MKLTKHAYIYIYAEVLLCTTAGMWGHDDVRQARRVELETSV